MTRYELFYGTGGHGGPHEGLSNAVAHAKALLRGNRNEHRIEVRPYTPEGYGPAVRTVARCGCCGRIKR